LRSIRQLARYFFRFITDAAYRNMVIGVLNEHLARSRRENDPEGQAGSGKFAWASGKTAYLVGGCELVYLKDELESFGMRCSHSFELATAQDPFSELANPRSPLHSQSFDYLVFSQYQLMVAAVQAVQAIEPEQPEKAETILQEMGSQLRRSLTMLREKTPIPVFVYGYPLKYRPWRGRLESSRQGAMSLRELLLRFELQNREIASSFDDVFVLEPAIAFEEHRYRDVLGFVDADGLNDHLTREGSRAVAAELLTQATINRPDTTKIKAAIFDLDNTLWDGTLVEDGVAGLSVNEFRINVALAWAERGILLCVCSKNDPSSVEEIQRILPKEFVDAVAIWQVSWEPKPYLVREIATRLNLGLENIAFIDDSPFERQAVADLCTGIRTLDPTECVENLTSIEFEPAVGATQGLQRQQWQQAEERRKEVQSDTSESYEEFLMRTNMRMCVRSATELDLDRVAEVIARTNQLNATGLRLDRADVVERFNGDRHFLGVVELQDNFGDFGTVGVLVAEQEQRAWNIEVLAFSCRAMGRKVEVTTLNVFLKWAHRAGADRVNIRYRPSERNAGMRAILEEAGFEASDGNSEGGVAFSVSDYANIPEPSAPWLNLDIQDLEQELGRASNAVAATDRR
jgi:FkbH-like protein